MSRVKLSSRAFGPAIVAAGIGLALSAGSAAEAAGKLGGTDFVEVPAEKSGLTDGIDKTVKYPWMSPPVDVNGDGHPDLMYYGHHGGGAGFWFGKGDGTFTFDRSGFAARWVWSERDPTWWDVNGDGFMDGIRTRHKDARLLVNDGTGHWRETNIRLRGMIADLDGDGHHSEIFTGSAALAIDPPLDRWGKTPPEKVVLKPLWEPEKLLGWPEGVPKKDQHGRAGGSYPEAFSVDLDGDDRNELIVTFRQGGFSTENVRTWILRRGPEAKGPAAWKDSTPATGLPTGLGHWLWPEDLDVDGDVDLIDLLTGQWHVNDGKGRFAMSPRRVFDNKTRRHGKYVNVDSEINLVDLDNDGRRDLVMAADHSPTYGAFLHLGAGRFFLTRAVPGSRRGRKFADVDHDGDLDMVVTRGLKFVLFRNDTANLGLHVKVVPKAPAEAALGCKVWVWRAGQAGRKQALLHYRQCIVGQLQTRSNIIDTNLHVGLGKVDEVDVRVRFPSGVVRDVKGAKAKTTVTVAEAASAVAGR